LHNLPNLQLKEAVLFMHRFLPLLFCFGPVCGLAEQLPKLPLSFEKNQGQADSRVDFLSRGRGYTLFLTPREAVLRLGSDVLRMKLAGANRSSKAEGQELLPGRSSYFIGNDAAQWRTGIANYRRVAYPEVYPGIDLVYYGNQRQLEYDFVVKPGADLRRIRLQFAGAKRVRTEAGGDIVIETTSGEIRERKPVVYQTVDGKRQEIAGRYVVHGTHVAFEVANYDTGRALVIDPSLVYSTYLGGTGGADVIRSIALDAANNAYVTGFTYSTDFPTVNARQPRFNFGNNDAFVTKISADGTTMIYSTFLGGKGDDFGQGIAVDADGNAYVTGNTSSPNFPTSHPIQNTYSGAFDVFITKLSADGSQNLFSTYVGGRGFESAVGIAIDGQRNIYVAGNTTSMDFPSINALQPLIAGMQDAFVTKISADGTTTMFSTYLGGTGLDQAEGMGLDGNANVYVAGTTFSTDFPTENPMQARLASEFAGVPDGFVTKISADGSTKIYSTYLGGSDDDRIHALAVDASGNAYVTGQTSSINFPTTNPFQRTNGGNGDAFITKISPDGSARVFSTFLGGSGIEEGDAIAVDANENVYVAGITNSISFPIANAIQSSNAGGANDVFVTKISPDGSTKLYSTYLGGTLDDRATSITADANGNAYVVGTTTSTDFPIVVPAIQEFNAGGLAGGTQPAGQDSFILKIGLPRTISHVADGGGFRTTIILVNTGSQAANFDLRFWDELGNPMVLPLGSDGTNSEVSGTIAPGVARFIRTSGVSTQLQKGWAELTAPPTIDGNSIFGLQSPGQSDSEAAVPLSPSGGTQLFLPFDYTTGYSMGIAFANPNNQDAIVSAALIDDAGQPIPASQQITVPARGHYSDVLIAKFPDAVSTRGVAHFSANTNIFGLGIRANGKAFTSIDALAGVTSATKTIAHIANGGGWKTTFLLVNTDSQAANFTLNFWDDNGHAFTLPLGIDGSAASVAGTIQPGQLRVVQTTGVGGNLVTGWAQLVVTGAIGGTAIFALQTPGQFDSEAAVPFSTVGSAQLFMPYDYTPGYSTGVALTNPNPSHAATVLASIVDDLGHTLATGVAINVPANGHTSVVLGNLFPDTIPGSRGTVSFTSNVPILGLGIRANGLAFTSLKVIAR
jgi:hypothetical protein